MLLVVLLATLAGAGVGVTLAASLRAPRRMRVIAGQRLYTADLVQTFSASRIVMSPSHPLERFVFTAHGGQATIQWYCGALSPVRRGGSAEVSLYLDGRRLVSAFINGRGLLSARPGLLRWLGRLPAGMHLIEVRLEDIRGGIAVPLVAGPARVQEGVTVAELAVPRARHRTHQHATSTSPSSRTGTSTGTGTGTGTITSTGTSSSTKS